MLHACGDENKDVSEKVPQTEEQKFEDLKLQYGSWEELCKIRPECEDYPIGYQTVITQNIPYYVPLDVIRDSLHSSPRRSNKDFVQFDSDSKIIKRVVHISPERRRHVPFNNHFHAFPVFYFNPLAKYYGIPIDHPKDKERVHGGTSGAYWNVKDKPPLLFSDRIHKDIISEIENYKVGSKHDYDENFWFVNYGVNLKTKEIYNSRRALTFISKDRILYDHRLMLLCIATRCSTSIGVLQSDIDKFGIPKVGYSPDAIFLPRKLDKTVTCINEHVDSCAPVKGMLDTLPNHLNKIKQIIKNISTKPDNIEGYGE